MNKIQEICACVFIRNKEKVLVAKRADTKSFLPGKYELLGGHVEFGETLPDCLKRELKEELHVDIVVEMPFHSFTNVYDKKTKHYIEVDYFAHLKNPNQKIRLNKEDHSSYKWISDSEVYKYFDRDDAEAKAIKEGFRILKKFR
jgi:8-oxo-dGTP diphosphatase